MTIGCVEVTYEIEADRWPATEIIIMAIGFNFLLKDKFKTLNMVPALLLPVAFHYILILINYIKG